MSEQNEEVKILKWILGQAYRANRRKAQLDRRLEMIRAECDSPMRAVSYDFTPGSKGQVSEGASGIVIKMSEIEERITEQKKNVDKAIIRTMDIIDYLPEETLEREICELRHIDMMPWKDIQKETSMSRSQCFKRHKSAIGMLLERERVRKMVEDSREAYIEYMMQRVWDWHNRSKKAK